MKNKEIIFKTVIHVNNEAKEIILKMIKPKNCSICDKKVDPEPIPLYIRKLNKESGIESKIFYPNMCSECGKMSEVF